MMDPLAQQITQTAQQLIDDEAHALGQLKERIDSTFVAAVRQLLECQGRVIVSGIGKSGQVGMKIASTLASTGTPAQFVHPAEASHGDLGMIQQRDCVIAISKSGESPELQAILDYTRRFAIPLMAITAQPESSLGQSADLVLALPMIAEACPLGLAPTTSTTMTLALGDALAVACLKARDFQPAQFRDYHPGGKLGQKLSRVKDLMHPQDSLPLVAPDASLGETVLAMNRGRLGCVGIVDGRQHLVGIFTDGDLRRHFHADNLDKPVSALMTASPQQVLPDMLVAEVANLLTQKRIPSVFVCRDGVPVGLIHLHDLLQKGLV